MYSISRNEMSAAIPHLIFSNSGNIDKALIAMTPTHLKAFVNSRRRVR